MLPSSLIQDIDVLVRGAHQSWLRDVCALLNVTPDWSDAESLLSRLPPTNNNDAAYCLAHIVRQSDGLLSWQALGASLELCGSLFASWQRDRQVELLWTGPSPSGQIPARRIDQVLYDLVDAAEHEILLITFAAYRVPRLTDGLVKAIERGVRVRLILEFAETSQGQLSMDALKAFPDVLQRDAQIYYWPLDKRGRNVRGKPGKLHAKAAIVDGRVILSSANLTDDAFTRNLELGALLSGAEVGRRLRAHFECLCADATLKMWKP